MKETSAWSFPLPEKLFGLRLNKLTKDTLIRTALYCAWAFAVSGAPAFLGATPFGVALLCGAESALPPLTVALCLGAAARGAGMLIPIYIILLLFRLITTMWAGEESHRVNIALCAVGMTAYSLPELLTLPGGAGLLRTAVGTVTAIAFLICLQKRQNGVSGKKAEVLALFYATACAVSGYSFYGVDAENVLGFILCMNLTRYCGATMGCAAGALWGLAGSPEYAPAFAVSALIGGRASSPLLGVGAGAVFCMLFATFTGGYHGIRDFLPDITLAAAAYAPLSRLSWMNWEELIPSEQPEEGDGVAGEKEKRLAAVAGALGSLSAIFYGMSDRLKDREDYEPSLDMTGAFADDYAAMSELICSALQKEEENPPDRVAAGKIYGMLRMARIKCKRVTVTGSRVKHIHITGMTNSAISDPALLTSRVSAACGIPLSAPAFTSEEGGVSARFGAAPGLSAEWSVAARAKPGEKISGDCTTAFTTEQGYFFCILCDGMGSGKDAAIAARICCVFLQKMLEGGADPTLSVRMLNTFLRAKGYECFATVDIFCLDLYTGKAYFIKGGSAPSHLFRSGSEYTMASATAPVGIIREVYAEKIAFDALPGDWVVMRSDGAEGDTPPKPPGASTAEAAAKQALSNALEHGAKDDTTVCVIKINAK